MRGRRLQAGPARLERNASVRLDNASGLTHYSLALWRCSSAGQSMRLISAESGVQIPASPPYRGNRKGPSCKVRALFDGQERKSRPAVLSIREKTRVPGREKEKGGRFEASRLFCFFDCRAMFQRMNFFLPSAAIPIRPAPRSSMLAGSGTSMPRTEKSFLRSRRELQ